MLHDFNGKKQKIIQTCRQVDEGHTGVIKVGILQNLLSCLDVILGKGDMINCFQRLGVTFEGEKFIRYEPMMRLLHYDNHGECWAIKK